MRSCLKSNAVSALDTADVVADADAVATLDPMKSPSQAAFDLRAIEAARA